MSTNKLSRNLYGSLPFYAGAGIVLILSLPGQLNWPGIIIAAIGVYGAISKRPVIVTLAGLLPASGSLILQGTGGICPTCTLAAILFALAGCFGMYALWQEDRPVVAGVCLMVLIASAGVFLHYGNSPSNHPAVKSDKAMVYITPHCPACQETLRILSRQDPTGKEWVPVVVPSDQIYGAEKELQEAGYTGTILKADDTPGKVFPTMVVNGEIISGSNRIIERMAKSP